MEILSNDCFDVFAENKKLDIKYCFGWTENKRYFKTLEEAKLFCEIFDYKKHFCLGTGLKL